MTLKVMIISVLVVTSILFIVSPILGIIGIVLGISFIAGWLYEDYQIYKREQEKNNK